MSLFESASLIITPNATKAGKLYAIKPTDGSGDLTVTRATSATRVNENGLIESVGANVPRLDYSNGGCPSILVEPQRTNLVLNSATLTTQTVVVTAQPYTISFYGSGTVTLSGASTATIVGLGTQRKTKTFTPTAGALIITVSGTVTNAQLEAGSYATSYIPTVASAVTRNADVISKTGISSLIGQTEGTVYLNWKQNALSDENGIYNNNFNLTGSITIQVSVLGSLKTFTCYNGTFIELSSPNNTIQVGQSYKMALAYKSGDLALYINGNQIGISSTIFAFTTILDYFDLSNSYVYFANTCEVSHKATAIWKTRLTNAQLAELTTI